MKEDTKKEDDRRDRTMRFRVSLVEADDIECRAAQTGLGLSGYLRAAARNHRVKSVYDLDAVSDLVRVNADLGRVAGLLKLWLVEKPGQGAQRFEVDQLMKEFRAMQAELSGIMRRAVR